MSSDLQICQELPRIQLPAIKIPEEIQETEECRTPTSQENKIPALLSCPPAPRKPIRKISCKRKLSPDFEFYEIVDLESIFRLRFADSLAKRKRCRA
ncbi:hypothetical protein M5689_001511 [Euphorbia peplus]|nr:hypothetical protein M5689_001511 [Euphorbia peplus]